MLDASHPVDATQLQFQVLVREIMDEMQKSVDADKLKWLSDVVSGLVNVLLIILLGLLSLSLALVKRQLIREVEQGLVTELEI